MALLLAHLLIAVIACLLPKTREKIVEVLLFLLVSLIFFTVFMPAA